MKSPKEMGRVGQRVDRQGQRRVTQTQEGDRQHLMPWEDPRGVVRGCQGAWREGGPGGLA